MKVTKAQAQANRAHVVKTASALFRERGYDGVGVADLMAAAGFTQGGFYKHFRSKTDLMAESAACGMKQTVELTEGVDLSTFVRSYLSREHRDDRAAGCTMAALGSDAARQSQEVKTTFATGVESLLQTLEKECPVSERAGNGEARAKSIDTLAHVVGALVMSRACPDDSPLADEILAVCLDTILRALAGQEGLRPAAAAHAAKPDTV